MVDGEGWMPAKLRTKIMFKQFSKLLQFVMSYVTWEGGIDALFCYIGLGSKRKKILY